MQSSTNDDHDPQEADAQACQREAAVPLSEALCGKHALGNLGLLSSAPFSLWVGVHTGDKTFSLATCPLEGSLPFWIQHLHLSDRGGGKAFGFKLLGRM